ncbi:MAG: hypothetical protein ACXVCP_02715 [Bdellovibrio sp.]
MFVKWKRISLAALLTLTATGAGARPHIKKVARPPQYIMFALDGGLDLNQWQASRNFTTEMNKANKPFNFTYFLAGVYFLRPANKQFYTPPKHDIGYSAIGYAKTPAEIYNRINMMNDSFAEGNEIASQANGHFNGQTERWATEDWSSELKQFNDFIFGAYFNNGLTPNSKYPQGYALAKTDITGFRAPYLGTNESLWPALKDLNYKYDVSAIGEMTVWPKKNEVGIWRIPVPIIEMAGTGKRVIGMDYNFYMAQSQGRPDIPNREVYRKQMLDSYMNYFNFNYYGSRAPVNIGHHFTQFNGGAYWDALQDFAKAVCGLPEVHCVTFRNYVNWLDTLTPEVFQSYRAGQFDPMPRPRRNAYSPERALDVQVVLEKRNSDFTAKVSGSDLTPDMKAVFFVNNQRVNKETLSVEELRQAFPNANKVTVAAALVNNKGQELYRDTHVVQSLGTDKEKFEVKSEEMKSLEAAF